MAARPDGVSEPYYNMDASPNPLFFNVSRFGQLRRLH